MKLITFLIFFQILISAQYRIEKMYVPEGGVPLHLTYCMLQDSKGFIWFGTMYGLIRFDGKEYKTFRHDPDDKKSISFDDIISLSEDKQGRLWIGTWGGGLNVFDPAKGSFKRFPVDETGDIIWHIKHDSAQNLWLINEQRIIKKYNEKEGFKTYQVKEAKNIFIDGKNIYFPVSDGLLTYSERDDSLIYAPTFSQLKDSSINDISIDRRGNFILAGNNYVFLLNKNGNIISSSKAAENWGRVEKFIKDKENNIWAGTQNGLKRFPEDLPGPGYKPENESDTYNLPVHDFFFDRSGIMWVCSYNKGVSKIIFTGENFHSVSSKNVRSFSQDKEGNIWAGTVGAGLLKLNHGSHAFEVYDEKLKFISDMILEDDNLLYINGEGLFEYNFRTKTNNRILKGNFRDLIRHKDKLFLGTEGRGLFQYDLTKKNLQYLEFEFSGKREQHKYILTLFVDSRNNLWIGTYGGLIRLNLNSYADEIFRYNDEDPQTISNNYVFNIFEDIDNNLWIGTSNGLNKFDINNKTFKRFYEKEGLPNGVINGITADTQNNLWLSTNKGLSRFNPSDFSFTNFSAGSGLIDNLFLINSIFTDRTGNIYAGTANGLTWFHPDSIVFSDYQPQTAITSFNVNNSELSPENNSLTLNPDQNNFSVKFAGFDFTHPELNKFKYMLEGFDHDWVYSGSQNYASYTNVPPGTYLFKVRTTNSDGVWSSNESFLNLTILPPFYKTSWFIILSALLIILILYVLYKSKVRREVELSLAVENARREESEITRRKTALDFHDELGHRLTRISLLTEIIKRKFSDPDFILPLLNKISENAKELYTDMKDFVWAIDPKDDSLYELMIRLKDFGDDLFSNSDIYFEVNGFNEDYKNLHLPMDYRRHLILLFKEGMNNSIKYADTKKVILESKILKDQLELSLTDFGKGITHVSEESRGLQGMKRRAELIKGDLQIDSNPDTGTKIIFRGRISIENLHFN